MQGTDLQAVVEAYLQAYDERDLARCMDFFAEDATIHFGMAVYRGRHAIEEWHEDRFAADLRVIRIDEIRVQGHTVIADVVVTSKRTKSWRLDPLGGRATVALEEGEIKEVKFGLRTSLPVEGW